MKWFKLWIGLISSMKLNNTIYNTCIQCGSTEKITFYSGVSSKPSDLFLCSENCMESYAIANMIDDVPKKEYDSELDLCPPGRKDEIFG